MTHTYQITGMTCDACERKVKASLESVPGVESVSTDRSKQMATVEMSRHVPVQVLQEALADLPRYKLSEKNPGPGFAPREEKRSWLQTYKPVLLILTFITGVTLLVHGTREQFSVMAWMNDFMAGFFLVFSFFKLLNLQGFSESYATYDIVAKRWKLYGNIYPFIELFLGIAYLVGFQPQFTALATVIVMGVSLIGVLQSLLHKKKIRCACLGDVFNLPMSTITVMEDALMMVMAGAMYVTMMY